MENVTKIKVKKSAHDLYEAFADPEQIRNFWFSSSARWESGSIVTLHYEEYNAEVQVLVMETDNDRKIVFNWDAGGQGNVVTIRFNEISDAETVVEVREEGFRSDDPDVIQQLVGNKEGWVYLLTCLKGYLEFGVRLKGALVI